jgi:endonuclease/exonuclease/phosphatase family metal-dependent hydrolase
MLLYNLKLAWWNTALSPAARSASSKANAETYATICEHIKKLITDLSCDLIAICEVSTEDVAYITSYLNEHLTNVKVLDLTSDIGRTRFDIAVIYNSSKVHLNHEHYLSKILTNNTVKAAQLVEIVNLDDQKTIHLFLCHWASRRNGDGEKRRKAAANIVYSSAQKLMSENKDVIVMGDFNDNPYDESILTNLNASRCHDAVRKYPNEFFYNPFWRSVVSDKKYSHLTDNDTFRSGTHKYKQFLGTVWHSYDQIMFSGSFLGTGVWHLNEQSTKVIDEIGFINDFENKNSLIDHLPVMCEITRP